MNLNLSQFGRFLKRKVNEQLHEATGVDVLGKVNEVHYGASAMGISHTGYNHSPDKVVHLGGAPSGGVPITAAGSGGGALLGLGGGRRGPPQEASLGKEQARPLITTVEEFLSERDLMALTPHGGAVLFVHALLSYAQPSMRAAGHQMMVLCLWEDSLVKGSTYKGYALSPADEAHLAAAAAPHDAVARALVAGAVPENGYWFDPQAVGVRFEPLQGEIPPTATEVTLLLWSGGADAPRPIALRRNKRGYWKVANFAALLAPVRQPAAPLHTAADDL